MHNKRNIAFLSSQRRFAELEKLRRHASPGPGQYNVVSTLRRRSNHDPCFQTPLRNPRFKNVLSESPGNSRIHIGPGTYHIENAGAQGKPTVRWHRHEALVEERSVKSVGPWSYSPDVGLVKPRAVALAKYRTPKAVEHGAVRQVEAYIEKVSSYNRSRCAVAQKTQRIVKALSNIKSSAESCSFKSRVQKAEATHDTGVPGPGFYCTDFMGKSTAKFGKFGKVKKTQKFISYNNALIFQSGSNVAHNVEPQCCKTFARAKTRNLLQCFVHATHRSQSIQIKAEA